jgi:aminomethyltransferase
MNLYGQDMDERSTPLESGLAWTVDLKSERDFIGKDALLRLPRDKQLVGLKLLDRGVLRNHQPVFTAAGDGRDHQRLLQPHPERVHRPGPGARRASQPG